MNRTEHLLDITAEECAEVAQRCSKAMRFGLGEVQTGQALTNAERIVVEAKDLLTLLAHLYQAGLIPDFIPSEEESAAKMARVEEYLEYSRRMGTLTDD